MGRAHVGLPRVRFADAAHRAFWATEHGVPPSDGCKVDLDPEKALKGTDTMLDFALDLAADWREWYRKPE